MKESAILQNLEEIAQQLNVKVCHLNLKKYSYGIKSGSCKVRGEHRVLIDKNLNLSEKIDILVDALQDFDLDVLTLQPDIQRLFKKKAGAEENFLQKAENS